MLGWGGLRKQETGERKACNKHKNEFRRVCVKVMLMSKKKKGGVGGKAKNGFLCRILRNFGRIDIICG